MAITYPISFPSDISFSDFTITAMNAVSSSRSPYTFSEQVYKWSGQGWKISGSLPYMNRETAEKYNSFLIKLNGKYGSFLLSPPDAIAPQGSWAGTPLVDGASQTGNELNIKGLTPSQTNIAVAGDYLQLGSDSSAFLYKVLDNADSDGSGNATLTIYPDIRVSPSDSAAIVTSSPKGRFRLSDPNCK